MLCVKPIALSMGHKHKSHDEEVADMMDSVYITVFGQKPKIKAQSKKVVAPAADGTVAKPETKTPGQDKDDEFKK
jgi:hypothetical protein